MAMATDGVGVEAVIRSSDDQTAVPVNVDIARRRARPGKVHSALSLHFVATRSKRDLARCRRGRRCSRRGYSRRGRRSRRRRWRTHRLSVVEGILLGAAANTYSTVYPCMQMLVRRGTGIVIIARIGGLNTRVRLRRQRANHIRERLIRQPTRAVVGGPARPHPVTRNGGITTSAADTLACVIPYSEDSATGTDRKIGFPLRPRRGVCVQLQRCAKGLPAICGADVIDVASVATGAVLGINVVHPAVVGARFAPALVSPIATAVGKHASEIAHGRNARPRKAGTNVGVAPGVATVRGSEDEIRIVVWEAAAAFVHPSDVHVACGQIAGDLHVADEWSAARDLSRIGPGETVIS